MTMERMTRLDYKSDVEGRRVKGRVFFRWKDGNQKVCNTRMHELKVLQVNFKDKEEAKDSV